MAPVSERTRPIVSTNRTLPADVRKAQLVAAARKVMAKKGFSQMRVSEIVEGAGLSQGSFYLHFASKEDIVLEMARLFILEAAAALENTKALDDDIEVALKKIIGAYYRVCFRHRDLLESTDSGAAPGINQQKWNEVYKPLNDFSLEFVRRWQQRREIPTSVDTNVVSWLFIDTVNGALTRLFGRSGDRVSKNYETEIVAWVSSALKNFHVFRKGNRASRASAESRLAVST